VFDISNAFEISKALQLSPLQTLLIYSETLTGGGPMATTCAIPNIDPNVRHVGVSKLRNLNATSLKEHTEETLVIQENDIPLAVLFSYKRFLAIKEEVNALTNMIEMLASESERKDILQAFEDLRAGRIRSLAEIEADLERE
jgi:hypothetical protein